MCLMSREVSVRVSPSNGAVQGGDGLVEGPSSPFGSFTVTEESN